MKCSKTPLRRTINEKKGMLVANAPEQKPEIGCLKVSSKSSPASVAGAIAGMIKDGANVEIQSVGAGAVNQAVKAIAISRGFLSPIGIEIACVPSFADIVIDGEYRTAIRFTVEPRYTRGVYNSSDLTQESGTEIDS
jgi:stage V sporulation protein S